ncbi:MAG: porin family protein [Sphingobacterium hotanense]
MKKLYFSMAFVLAMTTGVMAQNNFGLRAGYNLANQFIREGDYSATTKMASRFHVTGYYDARINQGFSIQPGLSLEGKGGKSKLPEGDYIDKFLYLQVPVNFLGRVPTRSGDFFFGGGPYLAYGISAKVTSDNQGVDLHWGSGVDELNPFDFGLGAILGYRFMNGFNLSISSSAGLINISNTDTKYLNRVTSFSVGYEFGRR